MGAAGYRLGACAALALVLFTGCASTWVLDADPSDGRIEWTDSAGKPRVRHLTSVKGFRESGMSAGSLARRIIFGRSRDGALTQPVAAAVGSDGRIAVADTGCPCVHLYLPKEQRYLRIFGPPHEEFSSPVSVAFDEELRLFVSDSARRAVFVFDAGGKSSSVLRRAGAGELQRPTGLAYAVKDKTLFVTDTAAHRVYAFGRDGALRRSIGERGEGTGRFNFPTHLHSLPNGFLHVTDSMNFRVQTFDGMGKFVSSFGRHGDGSGDFAMPKGVAVDREGIIYVVDGLFDNIQLFNARGDFLLTVGRRGAGPGEFWLPSGLFLDEQDRLYVCDTYNQRIQIFGVLRDRHE
jgi:sugar lactone lactonase YvrE